MKIPKPFITMITLSVVAASPVSAQTYALPDASITDNEFYTSFGSGPDLTPAGFMGIDDTFDGKVVFTVTLESLAPQASLLENGAINFTLFDGENRILAVGNAWHTPNWSFWKAIGNPEAEIDIINDSSEPVKVGDESSSVATATLVITIDFVAGADDTAHVRLADQTTVTPIPSGDYSFTSLMAGGAQAPTNFMNMSMEVMPANGSGAWTLLSNFETTPEEEGWDLTYRRSDTGFEVHEADPANAENMVYYVESGGYGVSQVNTTFASLEIDPVDPGETATLYWRYYQVGPSNNFHVALTPLTKEIDPETDEWVAPSSWGGLESIFRAGRIENHAEVGVRDANRYPRIGTGNSPETFVPFEFDSGVWYEIWMVVHNTNVAFDDYYEIYIQGGQFAEPTKLIVEQVDYSTGELSGNYNDFAYFRNGTTDPLVTLCVITESGFIEGPYGGDVWYVDDFYLASGEELTRPSGVGDSEPSLWHGYSVDASGFTNTMGWLGWLYIYDIELNWTYSYSLENYIYVSNPSPAGGWVFILK